MFTTIGEALFDLIPAPNVSHVPDTSTMRLQAGGAPFNVAIALARLGQAVRFLGTISTDPLGVRLRYILNREGIDAWPRRPVAARTRLALITPESGDYGFTFYGDEPADTCLNRDDAAPALEGSEGIYVSSMMMVDKRSREAQRRAIQFARDHSIPIFVDANPRLSLWSDRQEMIESVEELVNFATLIKFSQDDLKVIGFDGEPEQQLRAVARRTSAAIVITDGKRGCWSIVDGVTRHVSGPHVKAVDPTGAGDAFMGAFIAAYLKDGRVTEGGLWFAAAAGAISASRSGAAASIASRDEIECLLAHS